MRRIPLLLAVFLAASPALSGQSSGRSGRGKTSGPTITGVPVLNTSLNPGLNPPVLSNPAQSLTLGNAPKVDLTGGQAKTLGDPTGGGSQAGFLPAGQNAAETAAPPYFVSALQKAGVQAQTALALDLYHADRHPGEQDKVYHGRGHSQDVATLMAKVAEGENLSARQRALLILAAALHDVDPERAPGTPAKVTETLKYLRKDESSKKLLAAFQKAYGFTPEQVAALINFTDFNPDKDKQKALMDHARDEAAKVFEGEELEWALLWGPRLAFVDKVASYVGSVEAAERQVKNLAYEIRQGIEAATGKPSANPTDEAIRQGSYDFIKVLLESADANLLPLTEAGNLALVAMHFKEVKEQGKAAPSERKNLELNTGVVEKAAVEAGKLGGKTATAADLDAEAAGRYIKSVMGKRRPTQRETDALLLDWLDMKGIPANSPRHKEVRAKLLPELVAGEQSKLSGLSPTLRAYDSVILKVSEEKGIPVAELEAFIKAQGIAGPSTTEEMMDRVLRNYAERKRLDAAVKGYPETEQGQIMRDVAGTMLARGGKSVEEIARDGVFMYVNFNGSQVSRVSVGRDPDPATPHMIFYVTRPDTKWKLDGYRNNRPLGFDDAQAIKHLLRWLERGGVPSTDFLN